MLGLDQVVVSTARMARELLQRLLMTRALAMVLVGVLAALLPAAAEAGVARALGLRELVQQSRLVAVGTPLESHSRWELIGGQRRIVTFTRVRIEQTVLSASETDPEVMVRTLGGRVGSIGQLVHGEPPLALGKPGLMFLKSGPDSALRVTARAQGYFPLRRDQGSGWLLSPSAASLKLLGGASLPAARELAGLSLGEATRRIREAAK
jgi:hypothetical protein